MVGNKGETGLGAHDIQAARMKEGFTRLSGRDDAAKSRLACMQTIKPFCT